MVAVAELTRESPILEDLSRLVTESHKAVESLYSQAKARIAAKVTAERKLSIVQKHGVIRPQSRLDFPLDGTDDGPRAHERAAPVPCSDPVFSTELRA